MMQKNILILVRDMALAFALSTGSCFVFAQQGLPPLPKAATPSKASKTEVPPLPSPVVEPPLLSPGPKDLEKSKTPCDALPDKGAEWMSDAMSILQSQMLRPNGMPKARDAYAELWLFFKNARGKGYNMDSYSSKIDSIYKSLYPAGPFAPDSPFERFSEKRRLCPKS